jgi:hypothetical protein
MKYTLTSELSPNDGIERWTLTFANPYRMLESGVLYNVSGYRGVCEVGQFESVGQYIEGMFFQLLDQFEQDLFGRTAKKLDERIFGIGETICQSCLEKTSCAFYRIDDETVAHCGKCSEVEWS